MTTAFLGLADRIFAVRTQDDGSPPARPVRAEGPRYSSPNLMPWASGSAVDQLTVLVCRRM